MLSQGGGDRLLAFDGERRGEKVEVHEQREFS
jgi:hypothetical protein